MKTKVTTKKTDNLGKEHAFIHYIGRIIYNYDKNKYSYDKDAVNIFRKKIYSNITDVEKSITKKCDNISQAIEWNKLIDTSILSELKIVNNKICNFGYASIFSINNCYSNPETHYFSKNNLHVAKIDTLPSYENMDFSCWNGINNKKIQQLLKGGVFLSNEECIALSQTLSLFLCEASRNPVSFITAPMCFELSEYWSERIKKDILFFFNDKRVNKKDYPPYLDDYKILLDSNLEELNSIDKEALYDNTVEQTVKYSVIANFFPMALGKAVAGSRFVSNELNIIFENHGKSNLQHSYDYDVGSKNDAQKLIQIEKNLLSEWTKYSCNDIIVDTCRIVDDWYDIKIEKGDPPSSDLIGEIENLFNQ